MSACPCCLEALKTPFLGLGGRQLAGACEVCGDAVCERCLQTALLDAGAAAGGAAQRRVRRARVCAGCVYALHTERGEAPPFPEPAGRRKRAAQAACPHVRRARGMAHCPDCGAAASREPGNEDPECDACGAPSHTRFNCCFACGASFGEDNAPEEGAEGYVLDYDCGARHCSGQVAAHMAHCPWCGTAQRWPRAEGDADCTACEAVLDATWAHCAACGEDAPLPERCTSCAQRLEAAACAARCEECRRMVCGDCFESFTLPDAPERGELLLCLGCAEQLGATVAEDEASEDEDVEDEDAEGDDLDSEQPEAEGDEADDEAAADAAQQVASEDAEPEAAGEHARAAGAGGAPAAEPAQEAPRAEEPPEAACESPWEVLGVAPGTPLPEVKRAYLALVAQYHPDKVAQLGPKLQRLALEETRRLNQAWSELRERAR